MKFIFTYAAAAMIVATGCGGPAYEYDAVVTGTVTIDGELANAGTVTFHPANGGKVAIGRIHPDGSYSLRTGQGDLKQEDGGTVEPGEYIVTVSITGPAVEGPMAAVGAPPSPGPSLVAAKYATKETSDLKHTVKSGTQVIILELEGAELPPPDDAEESTEASGEAAPGGQETLPADGSEVKPATEEPSQPPPADTAPTGAPASDEDATKNTAESKTP